MSFITIALAALLGTAAQNETDIAKNRPLAPPAAAEAGGSGPKARTVRYCIENVPTGTRIPRRTCMTRAEWLDRGFDPLNPED